MNQNIIIKVSVLFSGDIIDKFNNSKKNHLLIETLKIILSNINDGWSSNTPMKPFSLWGFSFHDYHRGGEGMG